MKEDTYCNQCGKVISSINFEICDDCKKNHDLSMFLKDLINFLGTEVYFDEADFEKMGIDEFCGYEYAWELSRLNLINLYGDKFFINTDGVNEFIEKYYIAQYDNLDKQPVANVQKYDVYDPSKVKITNNADSYKKDILKLVKNIVLIEESPNIPFPQSDDLNRFIFIGQHLLEKDLSKNEIKQLNQVHNRIVNMYTSTGLYFQVFEKYRKDNQIYYRLSDKGKSIFQLDEYGRNLEICQCILEHEIFHKIFLSCFFKKKIKRDDIIKIMLQYDLNLGSMVTIKRRASCVSSWMHWIFRLMGMYI